MSNDPAVSTEDIPWDIPMIVGRPGPAAVGGVDYLGLRQVNLDLMNNCLPGLSNNTWHIRPFSVLAWIHWSYQQETRGRGRGGRSREARLYQEKVETLFTWGHQLANVKGVPGNTAKCPDPTGESPLDFRSWHRTRSSTSLQAAVQYGPAMKSRVGYKLLNDPDHGVYAVTLAGEALAGELDKSLRRTTAYRIARELGVASARADDAANLYPGWRIDVPTEGERRIFRDAFFQPAAVAAKDALGIRSATISTVRAFLAKARHPMSKQAIREALARGHLVDGRAPELSAAQELACRRWLALQLRQAQRVALEGLLTWFEVQLLNGLSLRADVRAKLAHDLHRDPEVEPVHSCGGLLLPVCRRVHTEAEYHARATADRSLCFFAQTEALVRTAKDKPAAIPGCCARLLATVVSLCRWMAADRRVRRELRLGGLDRVSLLVQSEHFDAFAGRPIAEWLDAILDRFVISQHMHMAARRYDGGKQRLRFAFGDFGYECYDTAAAQPKVSEDHLAAALSLMSECLLVDLDSTTGDYVAG